MRSIYKICTCCGRCVGSVIYDPTTEPDDYQAEAAALASAGYSVRERCSGCGDVKYRAHYVGRAVDVPVGTDMKLRALTASAMVEALEQLLAVVRTMPEEPCCVTVVNGVGYVS